jgi:hypothetical protein
MGPVYGALLLAGLGFAVIQALCTVWCHMLWRTFAAPLELAFYATQVRIAFCMRHCESLVSACLYSIGCGLLLHLQG